MKGILIKLKNKLSFLLKKNYFSMTSLDSIWNENDQNLNAYLLQIGKTWFDINTMDYDIKRITVALYEDELQHLSPFDSYILNQPDFINRVMSYQNIDEVIDSYIPISKITDDFKILNKLGEGSYGKVYSAENLHNPDKKTNKYVLKEIDLSSEFLSQEIEILEALQSSCGEYIICYSGSQNYLNLQGISKIFIITDYSNQFIDLEKYIDKYNGFYNYLNRNLNFQQGIILRQKYNTMLTNMCEGLKLIHSNKIVHRDIKPGNFLINPNTMQIKYIDFGLAAIEYRINDPINQQISGTLDYLDPLLSDKNNNTYKTFEDYINADLFSLGATIYECINGKSIYRELLDWLKNYENGMIRITNNNQNLVNLYNKCQKFKKGNIEDKFDKVYVQEYDINNQLFEMDNIFIIKYEIEDIGSNVDIFELMSRDVNNRKLYC